LVSLIRLYAPIRLKTRIPDSDELEDCDLIVMKLVCLVAVDWKRSKLEGLEWFRKFISFNLPAIPQGIKWISTNATASAFYGYPFIGLRLLKYLEDISESQNQKETIDSLLARASLVLHEGTWSKVSDFKSSMVDSAIRMGELWPPMLYLTVLGVIKMEQGCFEDSEILAEKIQWTGENFNHERSLMFASYLKVAILIKKLSFGQALSEVSKGILLTEKTGSKITQIGFLGYKVITETLLGQIDAAQASITTGLILLSELKTVQSFYLVPFSLCQLITNLHLLKDAIDKIQNSQIQEHKKAVHRLVKQELGASKRYAPYRTCILRLIGDYYWIISKQSKALKLWGRSIQEGERLGARPDLSRTYFEVGRRLLEPHSKYKELNGIGARSYLEKAKAMFEDMDLQRDLDQLDKIVSDS